MSKEIKPVLRNRAYSIKWTELVEVLQHMVTRNLPWADSIRGIDLPNTRYYKGFMGRINEGNSYLIIKDCVIEDDSSNNTELPGLKIGIFFFNCKFKTLTLSKLVCPHFIFHFSNAESVAFTGGSKIEEIHIQNCEISEEFKINDKTICDHLSIQVGSNIHFLTIANAVCKMLSIHNQCVVSHLFATGSIIELLLVSRAEMDWLEIAHHSVVAKLEVTKSKILTCLCLTNLSYIHLLKCEENEIKEIRLDNNSKLSGNLLLRQCKVEDFNIRDNSACAALTIDGGTIINLLFESNSGSIFLNTTSVSLMQLNECQIPFFYWSGGTKAEMYIKKSNIGHFCLTKTIISKDTVLSIISAEIHVVQIEDTVVLGQLIFRHLKHLTRIPATIIPAEFEPNRNAGIQKFIEEQQTELSIRNERLFAQFPIRPLFRIVDSSLGRTEITGSDLTGFNFEFRDSKILDIFLIGTELPKTKIKIADSHSHLEVSIQKAALYNQLKKIYDAQGNIVESSWYHSHAMRNQGYLLREKRRGTSKTTIAEKIKTALELKAFQLNNISNNHGENWPRALLYLLISTLIIFIPYYFIVRQLMMPEKWTGWDFTADFFLFMDPTHKIDFLIDKDQLTASAKILDFAGRIIVAYGLFQFVSAFRRHGKKGSY